MIAENTQLPPEESNHALAPHQGPFKIMLGVILHPRATFTYLRDFGGRSWLLMAGLAMLMVLIPILVQAPIATEMQKEAIHAQLQKQAGEGNEVDPQMEAQALSFITNPLFTMVFPSILGIIGLALTWLIWSGGLHLMSTMLGGGNSFSQMLRMVVWSWLPLSLRGLLQSLFVLATGEVIANPGLSGLVASEKSITELVQAPPSMGQMVLQSLLGRIDLFMIWNLVLLVIGVTITARFSGRKAVLITLGLWIILTLLGLVPVLISSSFAQMGA